VGSTDAPNIEALARIHADRAVEALVAVMQDESATHAARVSAAGALLQWGFGKPTAARANISSSDSQAEEHLIRITWDDAETPA
jgi:hypothetical protein